MKALFIMTLMTLYTLNSYGQGEISLHGNPDDPAIVKKKEILINKGYKVKIIPKNQIENGIGDQEFIKKFTDTELIPFKMKDINGKPINSQDFKGKIVHINFWSVTCKPCIQEFPELDQLKEKYNSKGILFIAIAPESTAKVKKVLDKFPLNYTVIADGKEYFKELGIGGYPKNFFINREGKIVKVTDGTRFKRVVESGEIRTVPDNFKTYDNIISGIQ